MDVRKLTQKIDENLRKLTTYHMGTVQNKAYRLLKQRTAKALAPAKITTAEWAFLGFLHENKNGVRPARVAEEIAVEPPFITTMVRSLSDKGFITLIADEEDSRAKKICITPEGTAFVKKMEPQLRNIMRPLIAGINPRDLITFYRVLQKISENAQK